MLHTRAMRRGGGEEGLGKGAHKRPVKDREENSDICRSGVFEQSMVTNTKRDYYYYRTLVTMKEADFLKGPNDGMERNYSQKGPENIGQANRRPWSVSTGASLRRLTAVAQSLKTFNLFTRI